MNSHISHHFLMKGKGGKGKKGGKDGKDGKESKKERKAKAIQQMNESAIDLDWAAVESQLLIDGYQCAHIIHEDWKSAIQTWETPFFLELFSGKKTMGGYTDVELSHQAAVTGLDF